jgi:GTPase
VVLVGVDFGEPHFDSELNELAQLAETAGYRVLERVACKRRAPDPALFVGSGKADEIKALAASTGAVEVLFDQALSPAQQRNLERHMALPVNDRVLLILEIFAQRARSHEGKLQVELARLQYLSTRLVRRWSHLERQSGGIGMRGGPGETQIELDRRMIGDAIKRTKDRLDKVKKQRSTQRRQRKGARHSIFRWWATPTPANPLCSMPWSRHAPTPPTSSLPRSTPPRASCTWASLADRCLCPIRWVSSAICPTAW